MADKAATSSRIADLTRRLERDPGSRIFLELAREHHSAGNLSEAVRVCRDGLKRNPGYHSARVLLSRALIEQSLFAEARPELETVVGQSPENLLARRLLGEVLSALGENDAALEVFRGLLRMNPADAEAAAKVGELEKVGAPAQATAPPAPAPPAGVDTLKVPFPAEAARLVEEAAPQVTPGAVEAPVPEPGPPPADLPRVSVEEIAERTTTALEAPRFRRPHVEEVAAPEAPAEEERLAERAPATPAPAAEAPASPPESLVVAESAPEILPRGEAPTPPPPVPEPPAPMPPREEPARLGAPGIQVRPLRPRASGLPAPVAPPAAPAEPSGAATVAMRIPPSVLSAEPEPAATLIPAPAAGGPLAPEAESAPPPSPEEPVEIEEEAPAEAPAAPEEAAAPEFGAIPTPTLAEIYVAQGMPEKALEIYRQVLAGDPLNEEVKSRIEDLTRRLAPAGEEARRRIAALQGWLDRIRRAHDVQDRARRGGSKSPGL